MTLQLPSLNRREIFFAQVSLAAGILGGLNCSASTDYGPAIWNPPSGCSKCYTSGNGHHFCVIHDMEGYYLSSISRLRDCGVTVSIHYAVNGKQDTSTDSPAGEITQIVRESNYAWHALCWNTYMYGTEHEGFVSNPAWYTDALYNATGALQKHLCDDHSIIKDRNHIIGHGEWQNSHWTSWMAGAWPSIDTSCNTHTDPGSYWDWSRLMNSIKGTVAPDAEYGQPVVMNSDGRLELLAVGTDTDVKHIWQTAPGSGWSAVTDLGGPNSHVGVAVTRNKNGRLQAFTRGANNAVYTKAQTSAGGAWETNWTSLGGNWSCNPVVATNSDGTIEIFATDASDTQVYHRWQTSPNGGWNANWASIGGPGTQDGFCVGLNSDGRLEIFGVGNDTDVWHAWQTSPGGAWTSWASLNGPNTNPNINVARNANGRLELFVIGDNTDIYTKSQTSAGGSWESSWTDLGGPGSKEGFCVGANADGHLEIFVVGDDNNVYHRYQTAPNGGWSSGFSSLNGAGTKRGIAVAANSDGRLELFGIEGSTLYHLWQTNSNSSVSWKTSWASLGGSLSGL